jgi:dihydrofolate reductase
MRKLIASEFVTLDGVMEAPGGEPGHPHTDWVSLLAGKEEFDYKLNEIREAGALLVGRITYDSFAGAWPEREGEFAEKLNSMPKYVASSTLRDPAWNNTQVLSHDVPEEVAALKAQDGGPILLHGSRRLLRTLLEHDLVDELRLMIFPVTVGGGDRLFPETSKKTVFRLTDSRTYPSGVVVLVYERPEA